MAVSRRTQERVTTRFVRMAIVEGELPARELRAEDMLNEARIYLAMDEALVAEWCALRSVPK